IDAHFVHSAGCRKVVSSPAALRRLAVNDDCRLTEIKKKRQREETRLDLNTGPGCLCSHVPCQQKPIQDWGLAAARGSAAVSFGFQRRQGLRAAVASSSRPMRVECGAFSNSSGVSSASCAIARIASMN